MCTGLVDARMSIGQMIGEMAPARARLIARRSREALSWDIAELDVATTGIGPVVAATMCRRMPGLGRSATVGRRPHW